MKTLDTNLITPQRRFSLSLVVAMLLGMFSPFLTSAQTPTNLCSGHTQNNGASSITFNVENTNGFPIEITTLSCYIGSGSQAIQVLYNTTPINSSGSTWTQGTVGAGQNGWVSAYNATQTIATAGVNTISSTLSIIIPPGTTYGMAISSTSVSYMTLTAGAGVNTFSAGGVNIKTGDNISWGGGTYPATPVNYPRGFHGCIGFLPVGPCTDPPTAGTPTTTATSLCNGQTAVLGISGGTGGTGQTYEWKVSGTAGGPYTSLGAAALASAYTVTPSVGTSYYVCDITCGASTVTTSEISINVPTPFPGGNYTINSAFPTGGSNFASFTDAVSAISCGISGPVVFDVDPASGPYTEQISLPATIGANATNTVTFNGNGTTIQFNSTNANARHIIRLNGADYITFNDLVIDGSAAAATYAWGLHLQNGADYNNFNFLTIKTSITNTTSGNHYPVVMSNSVTSPTTAGNTGNYNNFADNTMTGGYYGVSAYGGAVGTEALSNNFTNNIISEFYLYGIFLGYQKNGNIIGNDISRPTRTNASTSAGIYFTIGEVGMNVENNRVHNMFDAVTTNTSTFYGIYISSDATVAAPNRVVNNVVYDIRHNGSDYGIYTTGSDYLEVYHNTISLDNTASTAGLAYGIYQTTTALSNIFRNNMITIARGGSGAKVGLYYNTNTSVITSNNNNVFINSTGTGTKNYGNYGGTNFANLVNWQTANSGAFEANGTQSDPGYVSPATGDFQPTAIATNNTGSNVGVAYDINGNLRSVVAPDAGAYEYSLPGLDAAITWVSPTSPTTAGLKTITVYVFNNLANTITSLDLNYTDGGTPVTESFTGLNLLSSTGQTFTFTTQYNLTASATLRAYISAVNGGADDNQLNDTTSFQNLCLSMAGAYTVNSALPTGSGNFQTFGALAAALSCGGITGPVTVDVVAGSGPYNQQVQFNSIAGVSATNTITINGNGNALEFNSAAGDAHTLRLNGADYMTWNNINVNATGTTQGIALLVSNLSNNNNFNNCNFTTSTTSTSSISSAVAFSSSTTSPTSTGNTGNNNIFTTCNMTGGYYCVSLYGNTVAPGNIVGNQFIDCNIREFYFYGFFNNYATNTVVRGCVVERPTRTNASTGYGIYFSTSSIGCLAQGNRVQKLFGGLAATHTNAAYCLYIGSGGTVGNENKLINNLVSDINGNGAIYGIYSPSSAYIHLQIYHNTISLDQTSSSATAITYGIYSLANTGVDIRNNIVSITRGGTGTKYCVYYSPMPAISNYNDLYLNAAAGTANYVAYNGTTPYTTLLGYTSANPLYDQQSVNLNPGFNNPAVGDYKPTSVALDNLGTSIAAVTTDITGAPRSATPDMGAYEFVIVGTDVGMFSFDAPGAAGCYSAAENIVVTIKNFGSATLDFSVNPVTVNGNVSGAATVALTTNISTGTLAPGATMTVTLTPPVDMTPNGTYTFSGFSTSMLGDGNPTNDLLNGTVTRTVGVVAGTIASNLPSICVTGTPVLSISGHYGGSIQWQESSVSATGPWTNVGTGATTYTPSSAVTTTTHYQAVLTCNTNIVSTNVVTIVVNSPSLISTTPGSRCGTGTVDLSAVPASGQTVNWYANATGGLPLGNGNSFTTPSITSTTDFYASAVSGLGILNGLGNTTFPTASGMNAKRGIQFDAYQSFTLSSFDFPAAFAGTTTMLVELRNSAGTVLLTANVSETSTNASLAWHTVNLNWIIPAGTGYRLTCQFLTGSLSNYSHSTGANYALPAFNNLGPVGLITAGIETTLLPVSTGYYYFYNLSVVAGCESTRVPVTATVNTPPLVTISPSVALCNGQSTTITASSTNDPNYTYTWMPGSLSGASITVTPTNTTTYSLSAIDNTTGTFATCATQGVSTVTVNPVPTAVVVSPAAASACPGTIHTLVATGGTIGGIFTLGTGTGVTSTMGVTPYGSFYEGARVQYIMQASELIALGMVAGPISSMAFDVTIPGPGTFAQSGFTVKMASTAASAFAAAYATPTGAFTTVYGPVSQGAPTTGWNTMTFSTPFNWDGVSNVLIDICHDNDITNVCASCYSTSSEVRTTTTSFNSVYGTYNDNAGACGLVATLATTVFNTRPNMRFNSVVNQPLTWSPTAGLFTDAAATVPYTGGNTYTVYANPTASTSYTATATSPQGCANTGTTVITVNVCSTALTLNAFIEGYWDGVSAMVPALSNQGQANPVTDCDSITVELRDENSPHGALYTTTAVLQTNGTATCIFSPGVTPGNYYIAIKHRNALQTWSAAPVAIGATGSYNFTSAATQAYGTAAQVQVAPGIWAMYSGDVVIDENMDLLDIGSVEFDASSFLFGYYSTDLNGDGNVDLLDTPVVEINAGAFVFSQHP